MKTSKATLAPNLYLLKLKNDVNSYYLYCLFKSKLGQELLKSINASTSLGAIYKEDVKGMKLIFPSLNEQTAIATALSDMDSLISALDKKIEKKKAIKQGLMQQLLTGKKRLSGFTDKWIGKELQDILKYTQPTNYIVQSANYIESGTPVLTAGKSFILGYTSEKNGIFNNTPTILFDDFLTCSRYVDFDFKVKSSAVKMLSLKDNKCNLYFVYCKMQQIGYEATDHQRHWISIYSKIKIEIPPTLAEQTAIATILSDCDKVISSLEAKRDKYKEMKQGMMQQLLTGNIRLI